MKIAVLCGGISAEREVSLKSGAAVEAGLREAGYQTVKVDVSSVSGLIEEWPAIGANAAFIALHGGWGEDGRLQAALQARGIPYTGSHALSCMMCMDKESGRRIMESGHIPIPPGIAIRPSDKYDFRKMIENWKKIVVKPASNGSTIAVAITADPAEAERALDAVWDIDTKAIAEKFIPGRELTVPVFGTGEDTFAMPIIEIRPHSGFYDYTSKYTKGETDYLCPAPLDETTAWTVSEYARRAHVLLGCRTYSRVDLRFNDADGGIFIMEANTAPGMTDTSLVPKAALAYGWTFPQLLDNIVKDAVGENT